MLSRRPPAAGSTAHVGPTLDALRRIIQALRVGAAATSRRGGLSSAQAFALQQLAEHPGVSINEIAALTFTHQSSVSVVIQRLVARRLVVKVSATGDRRRLELGLTPAGRRMAQSAPALVQERLIAAIATLPARDGRALAAALGAVARAVTPGRAPRHPPMLFEDSVRRR